MCLDDEQFLVDAEAPVVELPIGRSLFVLFTRRPEEPGSENWLYSTSGIKADLERDPQSMKVTASTAKRDLDGDGLSDVPMSTPLPYLVTFMDNKDPRTIRAVDFDDLAAVFGDGYRLRRIALTPLPSPSPNVPGRVERLLPWLSTFRTAGVAKPDGSKPFPNDIARYSFVQRGQARRDTDARRAVRANMVGPPHPVTIHAAGQHSPAIRPATASVPAASQGARRLMRVTTTPFGSVAPKEYIVVCGARAIEVPGLFPRIGSWPTRIQQRPASRPSPQPAGCRSARV